MLYRLQLDEIVKEAEKQKCSLSDLIKRNPLRQG